MKRLQWEDTRGGAFFNYSTIKCQWILWSWMKLNTRDSLWCEALSCGEFVDEKNNLISLGLCNKLLNACPRPYLSKGLTACGHESFAWRRADGVAWTTCETQTQWLYPRSQSRLQNSHCTLCTSQCTHLILNMCCTKQKSNATVSNSLL